MYNRVLQRTPNRQTTELRIDLWLVVLIVAEIWMQRIGNLVSDSSSRFSRPFSHRRIDNCNLIKGWVRIERRVPCSDFAKIFRWRDQNDRGRDHIN